MGLGSGKSPRIDLHPLDFRRGDRLGSEEETGQWDELWTRAAVEVGDCLLGFGDDTRHVSWQPAGSDRIAERE